MIMKRRGRKPGKKTTEKLFHKRGSKWMACITCGEDVWVDADTAQVTCGSCVQKMILPPQKPKPAISAEEKKLRAERKLEKARMKEAKKKGIKIKERTDIGYKRGWQLRKLFEIEIDGKMIFYSKGKKISEKEAKKIKSEAEEKEKQLAQKKKDAKPLGWHRMKKYVDRDGTVYSYGKSVPATKKLKKTSKKHKTRRAQK